MKDESLGSAILIAVLSALLVVVGIFEILAFSYIGWSVATADERAAIQQQAGQPTVQQTAAPVTQQPQNTPATVEQTTPQPAPDPSKNQADGSAIKIVSENLHIYAGTDGKPKALYLCEVTNSGNTAIKLQNISIDTKDDSGNVLTSKTLVSSYPDVIAPGKSAFICEEVIGIIDTDVDASAAKTATLHYGEAQKQPGTVFAEITQASLNMKSGFPNLTGAIKNTGDEVLENVYIAVPVFSKDGDMQTHIFTIVQQLNPGQEKGFDQIALQFDPNLDYTSSYLGDISVYTPVYF